MTPTRPPKRAAAWRSSSTPSISAEPDQSDIIRTRTYLTDAADWEAVGLVHGEVMGDNRPASTMVVVSALLDPRWKVEIEAEALLD